MKIIGYIVNEIVEEDGLKMFKAHEVFTSFDSAKALFDELISQDNYGFAENGVRTHLNDYYETNYKDGYIAYDIEEIIINLEGEAYESIKIN